MHLTLTLQKLTVSLPSYALYTLYIIAGHLKTSIMIAACRVRRLHSLSRALKRNSGRTRAGHPDETANLFNAALSVQICVAHSSSPTIALVSPSAQLLVHSLATRYQSLKFAIRQIYVHR